MANSEGLPGLASAVLVGVSALEVARAVLAPSFPALSEPASIVLRSVLAAIWITGAIALLLRARPRTGSVTLVGRLAWTSMTIYGLAETLLRVGDGSVHLVAAMIVAVAVESAAGTLEPERDKASSLRGA